MAARVEPLVIGVDFGTQAGRAVVVRVRDGAEVGAAVHPYANGVLGESLPNGRPLPPGWALHVPVDYLEVLRTAVPQALRDAAAEPRQVIGIGTDVTACTMVPVTAAGTPLCQLPEYADEPHAYVKMWKHRAAQPHADRINDLARERAEKWLPRYGGLIRAESEFAKALQIVTEAPRIYAAARHFVQLADWIVWQLTGNYVRTMCGAGYKGIYQDGQYPSRDFLGELDPGFTDFVVDKLAHPLGRAGAPAGMLTARAAAWTGLPEGIAVAVGNVDAHVAAPAARAIEPGQLTAVMGTSTCHLLNSPELREIPGICGVVDGGIVPGLWGYDAGRSGLAGRTSPARDAGRAWLEPTAFGTRTIVDAFADAGVPVREVVVTGGLVRDEPLMQIFADVTNLPVSITGSVRAPALGSAMHAAVAAGAYPDIRAAAAVMGSVVRDVYLPIAANVEVYQELFEAYRALCDDSGRGGDPYRLRVRRDIRGGHM